MEDRFKFRAWSLVNAEMCEVQGWVDDMNGRLLHLNRHQGSCDHIEEYETDPETKVLHYIVEQCTGLKDKNGRLIYEGDVVVTDFGVVSPSVDDCRYSVEWLSGAWCLRHCQSREETFFLFTIPGQAEVIGNIHENPEILK